MNFANVRIPHLAFSMTCKQTSSSQQAYINVNTQCMHTHTHTHTHTHLHTHTYHKREKGKSKDKGSKYISLKVVCEKKFALPLPTHLPIRDAMKKKQDPISLRTTKKSKKKRKETP